MAADEPRRCTLGELCTDPAPDGGGSVLVRREGEQPANFRKRRTCCPACRSLVCTRAGKLPGEHADWWRETAPLDLAGRTFADDPAAARAEGPLTLATRRETHVYAVASITRCFE